jgi:hypothetical protein
MRRHAVKIARSDIAGGVLQAYAAEAAALSY